VHAQDGGIDRRPFDRGPATICSGPTFQPEASAQQVVYGHSSLSYRATAHLNPKGATKHATIICSANATRLVGTIGLNAVHSN
jgi:hypothetical protein